MKDRISKYLICGFVVAFFSFPLFIEKSAQGQHAGG